MGRFKLIFLLATFYIAIFCIQVLCVMLELLWKFNDFISTIISDNSSQSGGCLTHCKIREIRKINLIKSWKPTETWNFYRLKRLCFSNHTSCFIPKSIFISTFIPFYMWMWVARLIVDAYKYCACKLTIWKSEHLVRMLEYLVWKFQRKLTAESKVIAIIEKNCQKIVRMSHFPSTIIHISDFMLSWN